MRPAITAPVHVALADEPKAIGPNVMGKFHKVPGSLLPRLEIVSTGSVQGEKSGMEHPAILEDDAFFQSEDEELSTQYVALNAT